jgi:Domain of unknown function (DUF6249)
MFVFHSMGVIAIFWIAVVAIVFFGNFFSYRERASRHRMIETLAEKGQPIPPEYLGNGRRYYSMRYSNPVGSGIYLMCIGIALFVFFWAFTGGGNPLVGDYNHDWLPFVGIFPFMIGLGRMLAGLFDRPYRNDK